MMSYYLERSVLSGLTSCIADCHLEFGKASSKKVGSDFDLGRREGVQYGGLAGKGPSKFWCSWWY